MKQAQSFAARWILPVIGGAGALVAVFFLYRRLDFDQFLVELQSAEIWWIAVLGITILLEQMIHGWKWRQLLFDLKPISSLRLTEALLAGYGANILVPLGISPLVRSWMIARLEDLKMATVLMTTAISRFIDGIVFAAFAVVVALVGRIPQIDGNLQLGLSVAGALNLILFAGLIWLLFRSLTGLDDNTTFLSRVIDWSAIKFGGISGELRKAIAQGIIWPRQFVRQLAVIAASVAMKFVSVTHFIWAGFAVGVVLGVFDYLFLMVFAGFAMVLARFVRVPGGYVIGSGFALKLLGVADEEALAMILFTHILTVVLIVGIGLIVLWQRGVDIRAASQSEIPPRAAE